MSSPKKIIISASRRTDIPAFYMNDFMKNIRQGYFRITNPFNRKEFVVEATPDRVHTIVFWSKDYTHFIKGHFLKSLHALGHHLFFHYTINSPDTLLEPFLPPLDHRLAQLETLTKMVGPKAIFWRFDPICYYQQSGGKLVHNRHAFIKIADAVSDLGIRTCITSFMDHYAKIQKRLAVFPEFKFIDPPFEKKRAILQKMAHELKKRSIALYTCCEKQLMESLSPDDGIKAGSCIPNHYLTELYGQGVSLKKDTGQRVKIGCGCRISVDVGSYLHQPCFHNCLFCYANPRIKPEKRPHVKNKIGSN